MGSRDHTTRVCPDFDLICIFLANLSTVKMSEAQDAFIIFDEAYEGNDVKEDYIEGLKVFDKEGSGKVPLAEVQNVLCSLGEKLEQNEATKLCDLLGIVADEEDNIPYMEFIDKLLAATA